MKKFIIAGAAILLLSFPAYADYDCDSQYHSKIKKLNSLSSTEMSEESKEKYVEGLEKAYQLCKEGKKDQASAILDEFEKDKDFDSVFSTHDGN